MDQKLIEYIKKNLGATVSKGRQCQNFSTFFEEESQLPRCLLDEYKKENGELEITSEEAAQICPFFYPQTIETKCIYYGNYPSEKNCSETTSYLFEIASILQIKLHDQEKKIKDLIEQQTIIMDQHVGILYRPIPLKYEDFVRWIKQTVEKIK